MILMIVFDLHAAEPRDPAEFEPEIRKYEIVDRRTPPPIHPILFTGSSSIRLWTNLASTFPGEVILNRGFGGSTLKDLLFYFDRIVLPYHPRAVVVYEGDNDLARDVGVASVAADAIKLLDRVKRQLPGTPVIFLAVKPSPSRRTLLKAQQDLNERLKAFARHRPGVLFADTFSPILDASGQPDPRYFQSDGLHLNSLGYAAWQPAIATALQQLHPQLPNP
jgi:lysophospholipase L1-like esterase